MHVAIVVIAWYTGELCLQLHVILIDSKDVHG